MTAAEPAWAWREARDEAAPKAIGAGVLIGAGLASLAAVSLPAPRQPAAPKTAVPSLEARGLYAAAGLLALSVLCDSAIEHDRGEFKNPGMFTPLVTSTIALAAAIRGLVGRPVRRSGQVAFGAALAAGGAGLAFHLYNLGKRPGGLNWQNLFYAAPIGAPAALSLSGLLGLLAQAVANGKARIFGVPTGRVVSGVASAGIAGTVCEAGLLHFRGAFQNPFMFAPVSLPPISAALLARAAARPKTSDPLTRGLLALTAALGFAGVGFHIFGVSRAMGGWKNWRQNMIDGPPIPAPPAFTALAIAGLSGLGLLQREAAA